MLDIVIAKVSASSRLMDPPCSTLGGIACAASPAMTTRPSGDTKWSRSDTVWKLSQKSACHLLMCRASNEESQSLALLL